MPCISSFTKSGQFVGLDNYVKAVGDFRFWPAVQHVAAFLVIWVVTLTVLVTLLALIVHAVRVRWLSSTARFLFFIPGAFAGAASVMLWLFLLNPSVSPVSFVLKWFGYTNFVQAIDLNNLPLIFTVDCVLDRRRWMDHHHVRRVEQHLRRDHGGCPL